MKTKFTGDENELKKGSYLLIKLFKAAKNYDRSLSLPDRKTLKYWTEKAGDWVDKNIKEDK